MCARLVPALLVGVLVCSAADARAVLSRHCMACHGQQKSGGLAMDSREALLKGGSRGRALVPGKPSDSLLLAAMRHNGAIKMPPAGRLADSDIATVEAWIKDGAPWEDKLWSLQPIRRPAAARLDDLAPSANPVDRRTWIRRATFGLTGLPPTPEMVASDESREAVVDRLLASPQYGERWARHWLDVVRYADEVVYGAQPQFHHYRDWVIDALNRDMPFDLFAKAHLAADLLPGIDNRALLPALTPFVDPSAEFSDDDRVDVLTRGFLGLTVACAQCHDHKYDPIPTRDYYSLLGIFKATRDREVPLADSATVDRFRAHKARVDDQDKEIREFLSTASRQIYEMLAAESATYLVAAAGGPADGLDAETLRRWRTYLAKPAKQHPFLRRFEKLAAERAPQSDLSAEAARFQEVAVAAMREKRAVDEHNEVLKYGAKTGRELGDVVGKRMPRDRYMLWQELAADGNPRTPDSQPDAREDGILNYRGDKVLRFFPPRFAAHLETLRARLKSLKADSPPPYPYLTIIEDVEAPRDLHVFVRGNPNSPGEVAPRGFLTALGGGRFGKGSGRLELAEAVASPSNPLTARVIVNRVWERHFGVGIVRTPSNFGTNGERPDNPELLDWLASRFIEHGWSLKWLHREILLSNAYGAGRGPYTRRRLDPEALRDSMLFVAGGLDPSRGDKPADLDSPANRRRSIYGKVSRQRLDPMLATFDFPNPIQTSEQRLETTVATQRLFLLNSPLMMRQAERLAARATTAEALYAILFQRAPTAGERRAFGEWASNRAAHCQALLASNEFLYVD